VEKLGKWARRRPAAAALVVVSRLSALALGIGGLVYNARLRKAVQTAESNERKAEANEKEARRQHDLALGRYRDASDTLERMLGRLDGKRRADAPTLKELRQKFLEDSLAFHQKSIDHQDDPDPVIRLDAAQAYRKTGAIRLELSQPGPAGDCFRQAVALVEGLPAEERERAPSRHLLAVCHTFLAALEPEGEPHLRQAIALCEGVLREAPASSDVQADLARAEHNLGAMYWQLRRPAEAEPHYQRAIDLRTVLVRDQPANRAHRSTLANDYASLAALYMTHGPHEKAGPCYEQAVKLLRPLVEKYPEEWEHALTLSSIYNNWSYMLRNQGKTSEALRLLGQAIDYAKAVLKEEPRHREARDRAFSCHGTRAQLYEHLGRWKEAVADWDRLLELDQSPDRWKRRVLRTLDLARAGEHARAAAEAGALENDPAVSGDGLWTMAIAYARSSKEAGSDSRLAAAERDALAERYAGSAVALLRKLKGMGKFKSIGEAVQLRTEPALQPLRGRPDFQKLLTEK
jgi:tetratricopeptide (TPR) repeat protein